MWFIWAVPLCLHVCIPSVSLRESTQAVSWSHVAACECVCVWVSVPEPLRGRQRHLSQHDTVRRDPSLPLEPALTTRNLNLSPPGSQAKVFLPVCVWEMHYHTAWAAFLPLKLCPLHQGAHLSACTGMGAQQGAAHPQQDREWWCWICHSDWRTSFT